MPFSTENMKIKNKILSTLGIALIFTLGSVGGLVTVTSKLSAEGNSVTDNWLPSVKNLGAINKALADFRAAELQHASAPEENVMQLAEADLIKAKSEIDSYSAEYAKYISSEEKQKIWDNQKKAWNTYLQQHEKFFELSKSNQSKAALTFLNGEMREVFEEADKQLKQAIELNNTGSVTSGNAIRKYNELAQTTALATVLITAALLVAASIALNNLIAKPVLTLRRYMDLLINEDYQTDVPYVGRQDEIGQMAAAVGMFRRGLINNKEMMKEREAAEKTLAARQARMEQLIAGFESAAAGAVDSLATVAGQLSSTAKDMSSAAERTNEQATGMSVASQDTSGTVQSVAAAVEEMSSSVKEISDQVARSSVVFQAATSEAQSATETAAKMLDATRSIGVIAETIEGVASQINLLALNATIESARAGDMGKGFAVVASEVKNLAGQTTKATEEIRGQLEYVKTMAEKVSEALVSLRGSVEKGNEVSGGIASAVEEQTSVTTEISKNMNVAASGVDQIAGNIGHIRKATEKTADTGRQILSASRVLSEQSDMLNKEVKNFLSAIRAA